MRRSLRPNPLTYRQAREAGAAGVIDISQHTNAILELVDLEPRNVHTLLIGSRDMLALVYLLNDEGRKYVDPDTNEPAVELQTFTVKT